MRGQAFGQGAQAGALSLVQMRARASARIPRLSPTRCQPVNVISGLEGCEPGDLPGGCGAREGVLVELSLRARASRAKIGPEGLGAQCAEGIEAERTEVSTPASAPASSRVWPSRTHQAVQSAGCSSVCRAAIRSIRAMTCRIG